MTAARTVAVEGAVLRIHEWGSPGGVPLLYWHGLNPFGALELNEAGPVWAGQGFRVVAFAAPGIADEEMLPEPRDYRPTRLADLIITTADRVGIEKFVFVGWSWGASIGVHLGARHPGRLQAVVLLDAGHTDIPGDPDRALEEVLAELSAQHERYRFSSWEGFLTAARETRPNWRPELEQRLRAGMQEHNGAIVARSDRRAAAAAWHGLLEEQPSSAHWALGQTGLPVLLVLARHNDTARELESFRAAVSQVEVRTVDSSHDLFADAPAETATIVATWLRANVGEALFSSL